jgi:integrase
MRAKAIESEPGILTPEQFTALLTNASPEMLPYWAIGGFAGLRRAELERLEWRDIDFESNLIEVTPAKSKTASRRHVEILPALAAWLTPYRRNRSLHPVCPVNLHVRMQVDRERAGITNWPSNALRHSYASYHLAHFQDAPKTALQLGHTDTDMVFSYYRQRVKPAAAKAWWLIMPRESVHNVIELAAGA